MSAEAVLLPLGTAAVFVGLTLVVGCVALYWLVLQARTGAAVRSTAQVGAGASGVLLVGLATVFAAQLLAFNLPPDPMLPDARTLATLPWGRAWTIGCMLALLAGSAFLVAGGGGRAWRLLALLAPLMAFSPAFAGHAVAEDLRVLSIASDGVHVLCAGLWLGTLGALALTSGRGKAEPPTVLLSRVQRFSRIALIAAPILVVTGLASAWLRLGRVAELWESNYGWLLIAKLVVFAAIAAAGLYNWRIATPRLAATRDPSSVRRSIRTELLLALAILLVTALLVITPPPGGG